MHCLVYRCPSSMHWHLWQHHGQLYYLRKLSPLVSLISSQILSNESIAASSRCTYNTGVSRYTEFCRQRKWSSFPASELSLVEFVASSASEVQYQTLKVYLAGIKHHHQLAGMPNTVATFIRLFLVLRGIRRCGHQLPLKPLLPITIKIVGQMKLALREHLD